MTTQLISYGWHAMFGTVDVDKLVQTYFLPLDYSLSTEVTTYPQGIFQSAEKVLIAEDGTHLNVNVRISTRGYLIWKISADLSEQNLVSFNDFKLSFQEFDLSSRTLYDLHVQLIYQLFNETSIVELMSDSLLKSKEHLSLLDNLGITELHDQIHLNMNYFYITNNDQVFSELSSLIPGEVINHITGTYLSGPDPVDLPSLHTKIKFSEEPIIFCDGNLELIEQLHIGLSHFAIATRLMRQLYYDLDQQLYKLLMYINSDVAVSWLYVQESLQDLEIRYQVLKKEFESSFTHYDNFNGVNYYELNFLQELKDYYQLDILNTGLLTQKSDIVEKFQVISRILSDKGEKEEQEATNNLVQIIGILAIFEVISAFLPVIPDSILFWIRLSFLFVIFPLLFWVWYRSQLRNKRKQRQAKKIKRERELRDLQSGMNLFRRQLEQQIYSEGPEFLRDLYARELDNINAAIQRIDSELDDLQ